MRFSLIILLLISFSSFSQELIPISFERELNQYYKQPSINNKNGSNLDTLHLPFIEDFSTSEGVVNKLKFGDSCGVYVSNRYCVNPPTFNVASFDGLDFNGQPYSETNEFDRGKCDTLSSAPIDLESKNNVYFSFWWQAQGNAVPQVEDDSIQLLFYDVAGNWNQVWYQTGQGLNDFQFEIIGLDSSYLHQGFKFKFESFGNKSGMYGVWHIDYIYLDENRSSTDSTINDMAFSNTPSSFLSKYWAMPKWHFFNNPSAEVNTSITSTINNFKNDGSGINYIIETFAECIDDNTSNSLNILSNTNVSIAPSEKQKLLEGTSINSTFINSNNEYITIENKFKITSNDQEIGDTINNKIVKFGTKQNDSISSFTLLTDYYAYDDGSAEQAFRITTENGLVVQEYEISQSDTLYGVSIYFPGNVYQYDSTQIVIMVWDSVNVGDNYNADNILYDERMLISVADSINGFAYYNFFEPVIVDEKFYIGYRQDTDDNILIGYDINSNPGFEPIYFNTNGEWQRFQLNEGVLMMRPHFKKISMTTVDEKVQSLDVNLFPNPATEVLNFSKTVDNYSIFDLSGKTISSNNIQSNFVDISTLDNGMYFIIIEKDGLIKRTKFIKQ